MKTTMRYSTVRLLLIGLILTAALVYGLVATGCSKRVTGDRFQNQAPVVQFVNVPPDSLRVSRNPVVYWFGTDADGQIKAFRYIVKSVTSLHGFTPEEFTRDSLGNYDSSSFVYLSVQVTDPKTSNIVQMSADLTDPVNRFVPQYVFLQAIDDLGLQSAFVWKLVLRNDNPPKTFISVIQGDTLSDPFINSVLPGGAITGVRIGWRGEDLIDYPSDPPPFSFRWKFYGPYEYDTLSTNDEIDLMKAQFVKRVFVSADAQVYYVGNHDTIVQCDTTFDPLNGVVESCDTILVDTIRADGPLGNLDWRFMVDDPAFITSTYNRVIDSSAGWITTLKDTLYNVFRDETDSITQQRVFVLWVTCRDDANVDDLTPAFKDLYVVNPKFERDLLVVDFSKVSPGVRYNAPFRTGSTLFDTVRDSAKNYWAGVINKWNPDVNFSKLTDYYYTNAHFDNLTLDVLLRYKLLILYNDNVTQSGITDAGRASQMGEVIYTAIDAGINSWLTMRTPGPSSNNILPPRLPSEPLIDDQYRRYFGVESIIYTSWISWLVALDPVTRPVPVRIEDFVGAYSLSPTKWPDLNIDTTLFHRRYRWLTTEYNGVFQWIDSIAALPEVDWTSRSYGTEPMYLYKSRFGSRGHFLGNDYTFDGSPVAHRLDAGLFRTVHTNFTTPSLDTVQAQVFIDSVLNWLYDEYLNDVPKATRYPGAKIQLTPEQVRTNAEVRRLNAREKAASQHQRSDE